MTQRSLWHALAMVRLVITSVLLLGVLSFADPAAARRRGRTTFRDKTAGIQIFVPATWKRQTRSSFPGVLVTFKHDRFDARIILAAKRRKPNQTATSLAGRNARVFTKRGWRVGATTPTRLGRLTAVEFVASSAKRRVWIRQLYAVRKQFAYVLTLAAPLAQSAKLRKDLLFVQRSTRFAK